MRSTAGNVSRPANIFSPREHRNGGVNTFNTFTGREQSRNGTFEGLSFFPADYVLDLSFQLQIAQLHIDGLSVAFFFHCSVCYYPRTPRLSSVGIVCCLTCDSTRSGSLGCGLVCVEQSEVCTLIALLH